jgi:hypothetical protein
MLSPLDALSVAGTLIQFVDFCSKVLSHTRELYKSKTGALSANQELELAAADLYVISQQLPHPEKKAFESSDEQSLRELAATCSEISVEISSKLIRLKISRGKYKKWPSFFQALRLVWSEDEIRELKERLSRCRETLQMHIVAGLK